MTTAIEVTKREMYKWLGSVKQLADSQASAQAGEMLELCLEGYLEWLGQDRAALTIERDTLRNRMQVLELANSTSGEVIRSLKREAEQARKALMVARLTEFAAQVSEEKENASCATCGASDSNPERMEKSVFEMQEEMDALRARTEAERRKYRNIELALQIQTMSAVLGGNRILSSVWYSEAPKDNCMHSFHPAFPSGELCTFCGVGK